MNSFVYISYIYVGRWEIDNIKKEAQIIQLGNRRKKKSVNPQFKVIPSDLHGLAVKTVWNVYPMIENCPEVYHSH